MCGIISVLNLDQVARLESASHQVHLRFEDQKHRGQEGFGLIAAQDDGTYRVERATELVKASLDLYFTKEPFVFFHHRMPSSSDNKISQTHPILIDHPEFNSRYLFLHNGVVNNDDELQTKHVLANYKYSTQDGKKFNDSEALAFEVASYLEKKTKTIEAEASIAFICLKVDRTTKKITDVYFYRNTNPLKLSVSQHKIIMASEGPGDNIVADQLYHLVWGEWKITKQKLVIAPRYAVSETKAESKIVYHNGYDYHSYDHGSNNRWHTSSSIGFKTEDDDPKTGPEEKDREDEIIEEAIDGITWEIQTNLESYLQTHFRPDATEFAMIVKDMAVYLLDAYDELDGERIQADRKIMEDDLEELIEKDFESITDRLPQKLYAR